MTKLTEHQKKVRAEWCKENKEKLDAQYDARKKAKPREYMWTNTRNRAKRFGLEFSISVDDIVIPEYCPILGYKLEVHAKMENGKLPYHSASLDRIDPRKGYIPGNVRVISWRANRVKSDATFLELKAAADDAAQIEKYCEEEDLR